MGKAADLIVAGKKREKRRGHGPHIPIKGSTTSQQDLGMGTNPSVYGPLGDI